MTDIWSIGHLSSIQLLHCLLPVICCPAWQTWSWCWESLPTKIMFISWSWWWESLPCLPKIMIQHHPLIAMVLHTSIDVVFFLWTIMMITTTRILVVIIKCYETSCQESWSDYDLSRDFFFFETCFKCTAGEQEDKSCILGSGLWGFQYRKGWWMMMHGDRNDDDVPYDGEQVVTIPWWWWCVWGWICMVDL